MTGHGDHEYEPVDDEHEHPGGLVSGLRHLVAPHRHDHAAAIDTASAHREGMRALAISLAVLGVAALLQLVVFTLSGSVALLADTIHNFSDALTAIPLAVAFWVGRRPPNRRYTYGYGRAEDLAGIFIVAMIALSALVAGWEAGRRIIHPHPVDRAGWVAVAGLIGFFGNELVAYYRIHVGQRIGSAALVADGLHARADGFTSLAVVGAALGSMAGWDLADPVVGLAISVAIINVLAVAARDVYRRLMDRVEPDLVDRIEHVLSHIDGIAGVGRVRVRWIGHELHADADVLVSGNPQLRVTSEVLGAACSRLTTRIPRLTEVVLHPIPT